MPLPRTEILLERAISLIMDEWGYSHDDALAWLNDNTQDWTPRPQTDLPLSVAGINPFIQVRRVTHVTMP